MSYRQGDPVSSGCWCHGRLSVGWYRQTILNSPSLRLIGAQSWTAARWLVRMNAAILNLSVFVIIHVWMLHNLWRWPSICSSNDLAAEYTKFYLMARFVVFQRLIPLFSVWEGGINLYSRSHFNNTCAFCGKKWWLMFWKHWLVNHLPVNYAYNCSIDRGVPVNSHCVN